MFTLLFILSVIGWYRLPDGDSLKRLCKIYFNTYLGFVLAGCVIFLYLLLR